MEKELKSYTGVLLRADLLNRARPFKPFLPKLVGWPCPVRSALKRTPMQDFSSTTLFAPHIKKLET